MTLPEVEDLFGYWQVNPPAHELIALYIGYEAPKSAEQLQAEGAMGPAEFMRRYEMTGGRVAGLAPR